MDRSKMIIELAEVGSIDALLARYDSLTREDVIRALDYAAQLVASDNPPPKPLSPLYCAHNGFMLGLFTAAFILFKIRGTRKRRKFVLEKIGEFLLLLANEVGQNLNMGNSADNLEDALETQVREIDEKLADYYLLGLATFRHVILANTRGASADDAEQAEQLLSRLGHPPIIFRDAMEEMNSYGEGEPTWQDMMSVCLRFERKIVEGLEPEEDTCFVALPFTPTYEERYLNFYRRCAGMMQQRAIRAWGDLGKEEHQELLLALIAKSGALLADVTEANPNVALEVGFALGQSKKVYLVAEEKQWRNMANVQLDWVYPYRMKGANWEIDAANRAGLYFTALNALRRPGLVPSFFDKPINVLTQLGEILNKSTKKRTRTQLSELKRDQ